MVQVKSTHNGINASRSGNLTTDTKMRKQPSLHDNVVVQLDKAANLMGLDPNIRNILEKTTNEIIIHFPQRCFRMPD